MHRIAHLKAAFFDSSAVGRELRRRMLGINNFQNVPASCLNRAAIADLTAGFAVKRGLGCKKIDLFAFHGFVLTGSIAVYGNNRRLCFESIIADEARWWRCIGYGWCTDCYDLG